MSRTEQQSGHHIPPTSSDPDEELLTLITEHQYYPERLAMLLWEWGEGELAGIEEPDRWQMQALREIGEAMRSRQYNGVDSVRKILYARASGRGIGKSACVGMLCTILMAAFPDAKITVLANNGQQLETKTWPEIRKWMRRSIVAHWFEVNSSVMYRVGARDSWFAVPITWNLENPQATAGQQNLGSVNVFIFDEASEIPDKIAEIALSGLTTGLPMAFAFGNPTMATGFFAEAVSGRYAFGEWDGASIDSRECRFPNKEEIEANIERYGIDSDYVRVWHLGIPPKSSVDQYFPEVLIQSARGARPKGLKSDPLIVGVDLAWGGKDTSRITFTHGLDWWSIEGMSYPGERCDDPEYMVQRIAEVMSRKWATAGCPEGCNVAHVFMDAAGSATVIKRRLGELGFSNVTLVLFSGHSGDMKMDRNVRSEIIRKVKEGMEAGAGIGMSRGLEADLRNIQKVKSLPLQFEDKDLIRKRLKRSTDELDALALTRYMPVASISEQQQRAYIPMMQSHGGNEEGSWMR